MVLLRFKEALPLSPAALIIDFEVDNSGFDETRSKTELQAPPGPPWSKVRLEALTTRRANKTSHEALKRAILSGLREYETIIQLIWIQLGFANLGNTTIQG